MSSATMTPEQKKYIKEHLARLAPSWRSRRRGAVAATEPAKVRAARALIAQYEEDTEQKEKAAKTKEREDFHKLERTVAFAKSTADAMQALDEYEAKYPKIED